VGTPQAVTDEAAHDEVLRSHARVLIGFTAVGCGPCLQILPVLEDIAREAPEGLHVVMVDVDQHPDLKARYSVRSLPTTLYFRDGGLRATVVGVRTKRQLLAAAEISLED
jgi:thioredoxin 1